MLRAGKECDVNIDECASHPCMNNASCVDGVARYICNCSEGLFLFTDHTAKPSCTQIMGQCNISVVASTLLIFLDACQVETD